MYIANSRAATKMQLWKAFNRYAKRRENRNHIKCSFIYNCQNLKATKISFGRWVNKQTVVHPEKKIFSAKKKWAIKSRKTQRKVKCVLLAKWWSQFEKATWWFQLWHFGKGKTMETIKRSVWPEANGEGRQAEQRVLRAVNLPLVILHWWIHAIKHLSKPTEHWEWTLRMCQRRFTDCNNCTTAERMLVVGEVVLVWGQWAYKNLHFLYNFSMNLKSL